MLVVYALHTVSTCRVRATESAWSRRRSVLLLGLRAAVIAPCVHTGVGVSGTHSDVLRILRGTALSVAKSETLLPPVKRVVSSEVVLWRVRPPSYIVEAACYAVFPGLYRRRTGRDFGNV